MANAVSATQGSNVGRLLRQWRQTRKMTQFELALEADVSTRHVSYVENGKSAPSREMLLILASVLDLPLRERNALLLAGGFAPVYGETNLDDRSLKPIVAALDFLLERTEPYAAVVVDVAWTMLRSNGAAQRMTELFVDDVAGVCEGHPPNLLRLLMHPRGVRDACENWDQVAREMIDRLRREISVTADFRLIQLLEEVLSYPGVPKSLRTSEMLRDPSLLIPLRLRRGETSLNLFTTITTLGTAQDVTLQELRIESFLPADEPTDRTLRDLAATASGK